MANKQAFWFEEIISDSHMYALQQCPLEVIAWLVKDLAADGCATGLVVSPTSPTTTAVKVGSGRLWMGDGVHGELAVDNQVDLTSYIPATAGNSRYVTLVGSIVAQESVPVVTQTGDTVNSKITDVIVISVLQGAESAATPGVPNPPDPTAGIVLADVLLTNGMGIILSNSISTSRRGQFPSLKTLASRVTTVEAALPWKSDVGHHHPLGDIDGLETWVTSLNWGQDHITGLTGALDALSQAITGLQTSKADAGHNHDLIYHKKTGDETHDGRFKVTQNPINPQDVVRLADLAGIGDNVTIGAGSTIDSGYAYIGSLTVAWVRGAPAYFSSNLNPVQNLITPVTFDTVLSYSITTENAEADAVSWDNDIWFQMLSVYGGNKFPVVGQFIGNAGSGWVRPVLMVWGLTAPHNITISNTDLTLSEANGQVYPKIVNYQLSCINNVGGVTWSITGTTGNITAGTPDANGVVQLSIGAVGVHSITANVIDSKGNQATKTITITLNAYSDVPLSIINADWFDTADSYPWSITSGVLQASGGQAPYTWEVIPGSGGTATTLVSTAIVNIPGGKAVSGSASSAGDWYVNVRCTDSAGTPHVVDKALKITVETYVDPYGPLCFETDETFVLMEDGSGKLMQDITPGEYVLTTTEGQHERGGRGMQPAQITDMTRVPATGGEEDSVMIHGVKTTVGHVWGVLVDSGKGEWRQTRNLLPDTKLVSATTHGVFSYPVVGDAPHNTPIRVAGTLGTTAGTYYVGPTADGPWFLVHNQSI